MVVVVVVGSGDIRLLVSQQANTKNNMNAYLAHTHTRAQTHSNTLYACTNAFWIHTDKQTHSCTSKQQTDHAWYKFLRLNFTTTFVLRICIRFFSNTIIIAHCNVFFFACSLDGAEKSGEL